MRDNDMYSNLRETPGLKSKITGVVYNLQIVCTDSDEKTTDEWLPVKTNWWRSGFIHESKLVFLPEKYMASIDSIWLGHSGWYVASTDCPEIVVSCDLDKAEIKNEEEGVYHPSRYFTSVPTFAFVRNLATGEELEIFYEIAPVRITTYPDKLLFSAPNFMYTY